MSTKNLTIDVDIDKFTRANGGVSSQHLETAKLVANSFASGIRYGRGKQDLSVDDILHINSMVTTYIQGLYPSCQISASPNVIFDEIPITMSTNITKSINDADARIMIRLHVVHPDDKDKEEDDAVHETNKFRPAGR